MRPLKLAVYLDEVGEDPAIACSTLKDTIPYVALRHVWNSNVCNLSDLSCQQLKSLLKNNDLSTILIASELGKVPADELNKISESTINRVFDLATYFNAQFIRIYVGLSKQNQNEYLNDWMHKITEKSISANITPLIEIIHDSSLYRPVDIVQWLNKYKKWKLLYDPAQLIIKQSQDPFIKYWTLLKQYVSVIDIHDYKIGVGHKPVGYGDTRIQNTINDAESSNFNGWYILEPSLGRKYGTALNRSETFKIAIEALESL